MKDFNFKLPIQVRFSDFDMLGHMNSAQYATLIELARLEYFKHINWDFKEYSNVVASFSIDYLTQIVPQDSVEVWVRVTQMGNKSFRMEYIMGSPDTKTIYAKSNSTQVCINKKNYSTASIPTYIREKISEFEGIG